MKKIKDIIKKNPEPAKGTNFVNPSQQGQYSAKHQVAESASLNQYLQSKGINPQYVSRDTKIAHSKSAAYLAWQRAHMNEDMTTQRSDGDARSLDVHSPTMRRQKSLQQVAKHYTIKPVTSHTSQVPVKKEGSQTPQLTPEETVNEVAMSNLSPAARAHVTKGRVATVNLGTKSTEHKPKVKTAQPKKHGFLSKIFAGEGVSPLLKMIQKKSEKEQNKSIKDFKSKHKDSTNLKIEETELEEGAYKRIATDREETARLKKMSALDKFRADAAAREKKHAEIEKKQSKDGSGMTSAIDRLQKHLNKEDAENEKKIEKKVDKVIKMLKKEEVEQIDELKKSTVKSWLGQQSVVPPKKPGMDKKAHNQRIKTRSKSWDRALDRLTGHKPTSEDVGDPKAAVNADGQPNPQLEPVSEKKKQMSKSARMIKALYKKKRMVKEDMYDHEKEDKSVATYGKKPKHEKADEKDSKGEKKPQAAAVLTGGTTLTGAKRDDIEIDPMMRNRPGQPDVTKKDDKDKKKEDSKKDK
jgi:hypothetical protein